MASLKGRLSRIKEAGLMRASELPPAGPRDMTGPRRRGPGEEAGPEVQSPPAARAGFAKAKPHVAHESFLPGWSRLSGNVYERTLRTGYEPPSGAQSSLWLPPFHGEGRMTVEEMSFFDLETTGLSGGSGTIAFLAAVGYVEDGGFIVRQILIDDYPGERAFVEALAGELGKRKCIVTYNGKAFDAPLLRTRCIMNAVPLPELGHIDLLNTARRLWKGRLPSCSLGCVENIALGIERGEDIPGALIPRLWLDFSSCPEGDPAYPELLRGMELVVSHNAWDVSSLIRLMLRVDRLYTDPLEGWRSLGVDPVRLARHLSRIGMADAAADLLEEAGAEGNQDALAILLGRYRAESLTDECRRVARAMDGSSAAACVAKAKFLEHAEKDFRGALECALSACAMLKERQEREGADTRRARRIILLEKRIARLERKMKRHEEGGR